MGEAGLELVVADLLVAGQAFGTATAAADERHGDPVPGLPSRHVPAHGFHHPGQFVPRHVGQSDIRVVTHPAVPVAAAHAGGLDTHHDAMRLRRRIGHVDQLRRRGEGFVKDGFHDGSLHEKRSGFGWDAP